MIIFEQNENVRQRTEQCTDNQIIIQSLLTDYYSVTDHDEKCYRTSKFFSIYLCGAEKCFPASSSRGATVRSHDRSEAEIRPVEPEQGNACAGKVDASFPTLLFRSIPSNQFLTQIFKKDEKIVFGDMLQFDRSNCFIPIHFRNGTEQCHRRAHCRSHH